MIVDTSAIMAILLNESGFEAYLDLALTADSLQISAGNWIELSAVITRRQAPHLVSLLDAFVAKAKIRVAAVSVRQAEIGHAAYREFGRGTDHPAYLNFGDCFAYALSKDSGEPLLFKGDDFSKTDIASARA